MLQFSVLEAAVIVFSATFAAAASPLSTFPSAGVSCLTLGSTATAQWSTAAGQTCTWTGVVGSNFGISPLNGRDYGCVGRCGQGCTSNVLEATTTVVGNVYTQDCFSHDICSFFYNSSGGETDPNCGKAFASTETDASIGVLVGCNIFDNPSNPAQPPTVQPVCV